LADLLIVRLVEAELQYRINQKTELYLNQSKLRYNAHIAQIYCNTTRDLTKEQLLTLADGRNLEQAGCQINGYLSLESSKISATNLSSAKIKSWFENVKESLIRFIC
jgi:hypothetical protein